MQTVLKARSEDKKTNITRQLVDILMLSQGLLSGEELSQFLNRSEEIMTGPSGSREKSE